MFEKIQGIRFAGGMFEEETLIRFFKEAKSRLGLIYGKNGSGKSTIARAIRQAAGNNEPTIEGATFLDGNDEEVIVTFMGSNVNVHVFNEDYVNKNIRFAENGLGTIVMLGEQVELAEKIEEAQKTHEEAKSALEQQRRVCDRYFDVADSCSPKYWERRIHAELTGDMHWAGREKEILGNKINTRVNDQAVQRIMSTQPDFSRDDAVCAYREQMGMLKQIQAGESAILQKANCDIPAFPEEEAIVSLLAKHIEKPELSEREKRLIVLLESGQLESMKRTFSAEGVNECPFCLQPVSKEYRESLVESIKKVLSKEVEKHKEELLSHKLNRIEVELSPFERLDAKFLSRVRRAVVAVNASIDTYNEMIDKKIKNPFAGIVVDSLRLKEKRQNLVEMLDKLEAQRVMFNEPFENRKMLQEKVQHLNSVIAYYDIKGFYDCYKEKSREEEQAKKEYKRLQEIEKATWCRLDELYAQKRDVKIAVDVINSGLRYIFFAKDRLVLRAEGTEYTLWVNGRPVKASDVSVGERNILGLCYFFADILRNRSVENAYDLERFVVLDDPVSSFDMENKVGILSFLHYQIRLLMGGSGKTKLLILTHDLAVTLDLGVVLGEIKALGAKGNASHLFEIQELAEKKLQPFSWKYRYEYCEMLCEVFSFARTGDSEHGLTVGNTMRRVLEAFSTFIYQEGIDGIGRSSEVLDSLEEPYKKYFENLMFRLVLNGESHVKGSVQVLADVDFTACLSLRQKQKTARDILCFMYLLNRLHVMKNLRHAVEVGRRLNNKPLKEADSEMETIEKDIKHWCEDIRMTFGSNALLENVRE